MRFVWILGIVAAVVLHAGFLLFGGVFFLDDEVDRGTLQEVELISDEDAAKEDEEEDRKELAPDDKEVLETEEEKPPDAAEILRSLEPAAVDAPALEAASLSAIEQALSGQGGGGDFAEALSFESGGRIGASGTVGALDEKLEGAFSLSEIDQKPRAVFQAAALYPANMRGKQVEGVVDVIFIVDPAGKVASRASRGRRTPPSRSRPWTP